MIVNANALQIPLAANSVHCVVTSPPYWGLRDYGVDGQLGLEPTPEEYTAHMVQVFREVWRVLRDDGTLWLNLGDSYARLPSRGQKFEGGSFVGSDTNGARTDIRMEVPAGLKEKDLVGIPWRVAFALQADGWYLRSDIIWSKPNPMPESVTDRPTKAHEYLFLLSKSAKYFYDAEAVKENCSPVDWSRVGKNGWQSKLARGETHTGNGLACKKNGVDESMPFSGDLSTRNRRTVWKANPDLWQLRHDLSDDDRAYALSELVQRGLLANKSNNNDALPQSVSRSPGIS